MFREVLVISYIKIYKFSAVISQRYFGILLECSFGLGSSSLKKYAAIHKTLITAAFSRRFKFVSVRRRFVICDLLLEERQIYRSFACEKSLSSPLFT